MKVKLVFDDWRIDCFSIYETEEGVALSKGDFHSGSTFNAIIETDESKELQKALDRGYRPVFYMVKV